MTSTLYFSSAAASSILRIFPFTNVRDWDVRQSILDVLLPNFMTSSLNGSIFEILQPELLIKYIEGLSERFSGSSVCFVSVSVSSVCFVSVSVLSVRFASIVPDIRCMDYFNGVVLHTTRWRIWGGGGLGKAPFLWPQFFLHRKKI